MNFIIKLLTSGIVSAAACALLVFAPAGTFDYWQAWLFLAVLAVSGWIVSIYFLRKNAALLQRRMFATETRAVQKVVAGGLYLSWAAMLVVSALDHRFGWSAVPTAVTLIGNLLVAAGMGAVGLVLAQNSHAAVTVRVEEDQSLVSTGMYGLVRHPMYTCTAFFLVGTPLALGSYWGLLLAIPAVLVYALRIRDEERLLQDSLDGYREYMQKVRYRVVPHVW